MSTLTQETRTLPSSSGSSSRPATRSHDLVIVGGGLAGLSLALQLRRSEPDLDIAVVERATFPVPEITHKVGESTVELGSWYLANTLGLRDHLDRDQLRKFGLRFFFGGRDAALEQADELGVSRAFDTPTWQVDRGRLENELAERARAVGVTVIEGARVRKLALESPVGPGKRHRLMVDASDGAASAGDPFVGQLEARWVIDAASRTSPLKRTLALARDNTHDVNANWFRVKGEVRVDDWSGDAGWQARTGERPRWLSTNQLMGPGYWVWIIPLASGATSIGVVADPRFHALDRLRTQEATFDWLREFEPRLADTLEQHEVLDFAFLRHFSHDCQRLFSDERWALTGEAGVFLDPLYSPGTDFIAISNSFITDLVSRERAGEDIRVRSRALETVYRSLYANTLSIYEGLYGGFGSARFMVLKTTWDYCYYWSLLALLFTQGAMARLADDPALRNELLKGVALNRGLQRRFAAAAGVPGGVPEQTGQGRFFDQQTVPLMGRLNAELNDTLDEGELLERVRANVARLERVATFLGDRLASPGLAVSDGERELLGAFPGQLRA